MLDATTQVVGVSPRLSKETFRQILLQAGSDAQGEAFSAYQTIVQEGVDPLLALAIFHHESNFGAAGVCQTYQTKSPGNTRSSSTGVGTNLQTIDSTYPNFIKYPSWTEGFRDLAHRLVDPRFPYAQQGAVNPAQIIPLWAPTSDGNSPTAYIQAVLQFMNQYQESPVADLIPIVVNHAPYPAPNIPDLKMTPTFITVHETANTSPGANALMHRNFVANGGGSEGVSFHYCVDDHQAIEIVGTDNVCWHAGDGADGPGNRTSIAIETCVNSDGNWEQTKENLARLVATLMARHGIDLSHVVQHNHWSGKDCPHVLRLAPPQWDGLVTHIQSLAQGAGDSGIRTFPETNCQLLGGFRAFWEARGGLKLFGLPITNEQDENGLKVQYFERARFEWHPGQFPEDWDVQLGRIGAELLDKEGKAHG